MKSSVIILGGGGHTKVLIDALHLNGVKIIGITDVDLNLVGRQILGVTIIGKDDIVLESTLKGVELVNGIGSIGLPLNRKGIFERFKNLGFTFAKVIHPSAVIAFDVVVEEGAQIMAGAVVQSGSKIGCNSIINTKASVDHDCIIGNHVHVAPGVTLSGGVKVGNSVHIGTGANIIQNVNIGDNVVIGAGSLVLSDIASDSVVIGVPAEMVRI